MEYNKKMVLSKNLHKVSQGKYSHKFRVLRYNNKKMKNERILEPPLP